jgi:hypothetical protein
VRHDLALAHWLGCHLVCLSSCIYFPPRNERGRPRAKNPCFAAEKLGPLGTIAKLKGERKEKSQKRPEKCGFFERRL